MMQTRRIFLRSCLRLGRARLLVNVAQKRGIASVNLYPRDLKNFGVNSRKWFSTVEELSEVEFHSVADEFLDNLELALEELENNNEVDCELTHSQGVMTLTLVPTRKAPLTWVFNKQTPNKQIWWSSPLSGPKRFEYKSRKWISTKDNWQFLDLLEREIDEAVGAGFVLTF